MYLEVTGNPDGKPLVFLHGGQVSGWMWTDVVDLLADFRCLVPDLPGIHRSSATPWKSELYDKPLPDDLPGIEVPTQAITGEKDARLIREVQFGGEVHG